MPTIRDIHRRNVHILDVMDAFKAHIYTQRLKVKNEVIDELAQKNMQMLNAVTPSFFYKGTWYSSLDYTPGRGSNKLIHPELLEKVIEVVDSDSFATQIQQIKVLEYIKSALTLGRCIDDMYKLIPNNAATPIRLLNPELINVGHPMSEEEVEQFKQKHRAGLKAFKRLFLESLLLV